MRDSIEREAIRDAPSRPAADQSGLPSGSIRKLWIGETDALRDHLLRLDPESRRCRFGAPVSGFFIERYAARALTPESVVHGFFADGVLRAAAELRPYGKPFAADAEAAFSVEREWQARGVGSALMEATLLAARNRGIRTIHMNCLEENRRMQAVAKKSAARLRVRAGDVAGEVASPAATPLSLMRELIADGHGMAAAVLDLQSRWLRTA